MSDVQLDNVLDDGSPSLGYINNNRYALEVKVPDTENPTKTVTKRIHLLIDWEDLENIPNILYYEMSPRDVFPNTGKTNTLYIATDEDMIYRFDVGSGQYISIGGGGSGGGSGSVVEVDDDDVVILELENKGSIQKITASHAKVGANIEVGANEEKEITREGSFSVPKIKVDEYGHVTEATDVNIDIKIPDTTEMVKGEGSAHRIAKFADDDRRKIVDSSVVIKNETYAEGEANITAPAIYYEQTDKGLLGKAENQWGRAYVKEIFENGESLKNKYAGKSIFNLHKHKYTPKGNVASTFTGTEFKITPLFTGKNATISYEYTPEGTVSQPTFEGDELTSTGKFTPAGTVSAPKITVTTNTTTVKSVKEVGTLPSLTTTYTQSTQTLKFSWSAGTLPEKEDITVATGINSATAESPTFTGAEGNVSVKGTPTGTISQPTFGGAKATLSVDYTPEGTINEISHTPSGNVTSTFTGEEDETTILVE